MLASLHQDHLNICRLLTVLEQAVSDISDEQPVNYQLIRDVLNYMASVSDVYHHPKEDIIYQYYIVYRADTGTPVTDSLQQQHVEIVQFGHALLQMIDMILMDAVIPLDKVKSDLEQYISVQKSHLDYEEAIVFPLLRSRLTEDDWRNLEQNWSQKTAHDPLFGPEISETYRNLYQQLFH